MALSVAARAWPATALRRPGSTSGDVVVDDGLDVRGNVELGVGETMAMLTEYNEISDKFAEPMDDEQMNDLLERQGDLATKIDAVNGWEIDRTLDIAADAISSSFPLPSARWRSARRCSAR